jgi:hypothetical protein
MLLPVFLIELIWDYGRYLEIDGNKNDINDYLNSRHSYYLRIVISFAFITWIFGYISNIYNVYYYIVNNINKFLFGD